MWQAMIMIQVLLGNGEIAAVEMEEYLRGVVPAEVFPAWPDEALEALFGRFRRPAKSSREHLKSLMAYGPFPEPLLAQDARRARLWRRNREELVIREDLRDLRREVKDLVATLMAPRDGANPRALSDEGENP